MGLLAVAGHRIPYAKSVWRNFNLYSGNCTGTRSCRCNVWLLQAPSLRSLAFYTVFHLTFNLSEFTLTHRTLYHQYVYAAESNIVPVDRLIPHTFPQLECTFVRDNHDIRKRFHKACVIPSGRYWYTYYGEYSATREEAVAALCNNKDEWWCDFCTRTLFKTTECVFF